MKKVLELGTGKKIILRHLKKSDVDSIWHNFNDVIDEGLYLPVFFPVRSQLEKNSWYHHYTEEKEICIIAEDPALKSPYNVIGQCEISNSNWDAAAHVGILGIIIKKKYRNLNIGRNLIDLAIRESKKLNNKKKMLLSSFSTNERAIHLFQKIGFKIVGVRKKQFLMESKYIDEILMELWIDDYLNENDKESLK